MPVIDNDITPGSVAVASGLIVSALMDALVKNGTLTVEEAQASLHTAMDSIGTWSVTNEHIGISRVIAGFMRHFAQRSG